MVLTEIKAKRLLMTKPYSATSRRSNYSRQHTLKKRKLNLIKPKYCSVNYKDKRIYIQNDPNLTTIYFVTPTYPRPEQIPDLMRLSHTLMHVPRLHWILADDNVDCSVHVLRILKRSGLPFTHISSPDYKKGKPFPPGVISRGVPNRRAALSWIHRHVKEGILYFGDEDNTYDLELFSEIRKTKKLSMVPVGMIWWFGVSSPIVDNGSVVAFFDAWFHDRKFPVDMAGFAVNIKYLKPTAEMPTEAGKLGDRFLTSAGFEIQDIEPLADNCTKVLVWHTKTQKYKKIKLQADVDFIKSSKYKTLGTLLDGLSALNVVQLNPRSGTKTFLIQNQKTLYNWGYVRPSTRLPEHSFNL
ncbi:hypothetical protein O0L34_g17257 [Tuta absoluta]|nr:hypothetical protein O0L34_g17257 [Tuta absoluta]